MAFQIIFSDNNLHAVFIGITINERVNFFLQFILSFRMVFVTVFPRHKGFV